MAGEYAVIGAGQFGKAVALNLARKGESVLVLDQSAEQVEAIAPDVDSALVVDSTDEKTLQEVGIGRMTTVVVAIGTDSVEASIMTTALLRQIGVPRIIARAINQLHERVLRSVGAHEVINPEEEMGRRLALRLMQPTIREQLDLGDATLAEVVAPEQFVGKSLKELDMRNRFDASVVVIHRGKQVIANPGADEMIQSGDVLVLIGSQDSINRLARKV